MFKDSITAILAGLLIAAAAGAAADYELKAEPVPDGFGLMGVDGKLTGENETDKWFFKFDGEVSSRLGQINAGTRLEVLPSAALEKMIANQQQYPDVSYRLWGKVTKYGQKNYIFADYFLPISEVTKPATTEKSQQESATADKSEITINEPNDELAMPEEIVARLQSRKIIRVEQLSKGLKLKQDSILADRTGFIRDKGEGFVFAFDALGRNIGTIQLQLLPCETLERTQRRQATEADAVRFKVAGIVTEYKGQYYLLLQRAIRVYSYGNF
jgi:hypothetical protein